MVADRVELPFIDRHSVEVAADLDATWKALGTVLSQSLGSRNSSMAARALGCVDTAGPGSQPLSEGSRIPGFRVTAFESPSEMTISGSHYFSSYELTFHLSPTGTGDTELTVDTRAAFPGPRGSLYRGLVIGTRAHVLVIRRLLESIKREAEG